MSRQNRRSFLKKSAAAAGSLVIGLPAADRIQASDPPSDGLLLGEDGPIYEAGPARALDLVDAVTLEAWVKAHRMREAGGRILDKSVPGTSDGYVLDAYPGNSLRLITATGACYFDARLTNDHWTHVVGVYSKPGRIMKLYLDGKQVAELNDDPFPALTLTRSPLRIGADSEGGNRFRGRILRAAVYNRALTAAEIARRAEVGPEMAENLEGAVGEWKFSSKPGGKILPVNGAVVLKDAAWTREFSGEAPAPASPLTLWYRRPAGRWLEALPIGSGKLGAMVFGGVTEERLQLNEGTLWGGAPHDYANPEGLAALPEIRRLVFAGEWNKAQALVGEHFMGRPAPQMPYQTVGNLTLTFPESDIATDYRRELDLDEAIARTAYTIGGVRHTREAFASAPDGVIVVQLMADRPGQISFSTAFDSPHLSTAQSGSGDTLTLDGMGGEAQGIPGALKFRALARVRHEGGTMRADADRLIVTGADTVTLLISIGTSYRNYGDVTGDAAGQAKELLDKAARKPYHRLKSAHVADHQKLFRRVSLSLGESESMKLPTDERVRRFREGADPHLPALYFQFGRYLLASCSRAGGQPATLQGLWNDSLSPPWGSKYTININTEMNYWPAGPTNLLECYAPLFALLADLTHTGARTARVQYGADGWVCHHNTDAWRGTAPVDAPGPGMWPSGGAWLCKSFWDHYQFTHDRAALEMHYPILKGAAQFFLDTLVEEPTHHWLVTNPSVSPENSHHPGANICAGPTMDMQILRDLFDACAAASEILGVDAGFRQQLKAARERLAPMQIGHEGQLQEWLEDWDAGAPEQHHRHVSHLYGLYPSAQITRRGTPDLFAAARKSLELRGDAGTGWSLAWKINLQARLEDGDHAYGLISLLLTPERTAPNLFDLHPPFQIDGNFGAASGIAEMLMQSHTGELHLLPALPSSWPAGQVSGLRARGGFEVGLEWKDGKLQRATILSHVGEPCTVRLGEQTASFATRAGRRYVMDGQLTIV